MASGADSAADSIESAEKQTLPDVIEKVGLGATQLRFAFTGGGVWTADGAELLLISAVAKSVSADWHLSPMLRGSLVTIVFFGVLVGNFTSGPISDRYGRRHLIIVSYGGIIVFSILSSLMNNFWTLAIWRLLVGLSFGLGQPPWNALSAEITPAKWRILMQALSMALFTLGEIYGAILVLLDDPSMHHLHWRLLLQLGAIPSAAFLLGSVAFLHQSPFYLAQRGQHREAEEVLTVMQRDNCLPSFPVSFAPPEAQDIAQEGMARQLRTVFGGPYFAATSILMFTCCTINMSYYGALYAFPTLLPELSGSSKSTNSAGFQLLAGALCELPGCVAAVFCGMFMRRKPVLRLELICSCCALIMFVAGAKGGHHWFPVFAYHIGYYGIKFLCAFGYIIAYLYASEIYPTSVRTTGTAVCFACGRVGAMIAPLVYEGLQELTHSFAGFFYVLAVVTFINVCLIGFLPFETFNTLLTDTERDYGATTPSETMEEKRTCNLAKHQRHNQWTHKG